MVDDDELVLRTLGNVLGEWCEHVALASSFDEGMTHLVSGVDLLMIDVHLGPRSGIELARAAAQLHPAPHVVAVTGMATAEDGLHLGRAGVCALVTKPFTMDELEVVLANLLPPGDVELEGVVRRIVGVRPLADVLDSVRRSMVLEALARTGRVKSHAATLLGITRQHLAKILERGEF